MHGVRKNHGNFDMGSHGMPVYSGDLAAVQCTRLLVAPTTEKWPGWVGYVYRIDTWKRRAEENADSSRRHCRQLVEVALEYRHDCRSAGIHVRAANGHVSPDAVFHCTVTWLKQQVRASCMTATHQTTNDDIKEHLFRTKTKCPVMVWPRVAAPIVKGGGCCRYFMPALGCQL